MRGAAGVADDRRFDVDLQIEGMTCASCAARIERRLNRLDGVEATVNFATEEATVRASAPTDVDDLVAAVAAVGYRARVAGSATPARAGSTTPTTLAIAEPTMPAGG